MLESQLPAPPLRLCLSDASTDTQITLSSTFLLSAPSSSRHRRSCLCIPNHPPLHPGEHKLQEGELDFHLVFLFFSFSFIPCCFPNLGPITESWETLVHLARYGPSTGQMLTALLLRVCVSRWAQCSQQESQCLALYNFTTQNQPRTSAHLCSILYYVKHSHI